MPSSTPLSPSMRCGIGGGWLGPPQHGLLPPTTQIPIPTYVVHHHQTPSKFTAPSSVAFGVTPSEQAAVSALHKMLISKEIGSCIGLASPPSNSVEHQQQTALQPSTTAVATMKPSKTKKETSTTADRSSRLRPLKKRKMESYGSCNSFVVFI